MRFLYGLVAAFFPFISAWSCSCMSGTEVFFVVSLYLGKGVKENRTINQSSTEVINYKTKNLSNQYFYIPIVLYILIPSTAFQVSLLLQPIPLTSRISKARKKERHRFQAPLQ
jgi:hypothetical protein